MWRYRMERRYHLRLGRMLHLCQQLVLPVPSGQLLAVCQQLDFDCTGFNHAARIYLNHALHGNL